MKIYTKIGDLKNNLSTFLQNIPDNKDVKIFLIQEHFDEKWQIWIKN